MKTINLKSWGLNAALGVAMSVGLSPLSTSYAGVVESAGSWKGGGTSFGLNGAETGKFQIELTNTEIDAQTIETQGTVTFPNGQTKDFSQKMQDSGNGFTIASDDAKGGGYCFGEGLCESYLVSSDGSSVAVTTVLDGKNALRTLITVLDSKGRATEFLREKMIRKHLNSSNYRTK